VFHLTYHKAACYVALCTPLLPRPAWAKLSSQEPHSRTPHACIPLSVSRDKFQTHTKQQADLYICIFYSPSYCIANCKTKDSALNDSNHSLTSLCCKFFHEWNSDLLGLFQNI